MSEQQWVGLLKFSTLISCLANLCNRVMSRSNTQSRMPTSHRPLLCQEYEKYFKYFLIQLAIIFSLVCYTFHFPLEVPRHRSGKPLSLDSANLRDSNRNMDFICHSSLTKRVSDGISAETAYAGYRSHHSHHQI